MEGTTAPVKRDTLEMDIIAQVSLCLCNYHLAQSLHSIKQCGRNFDLYLHIYKEKILHISVDNCSAVESFRHISWSCFTLLLDVDECNRGSHKCHLNAVCNNTNGGYNCSCKAGYSGDGYNCTGMFLDDI